MQWVCTTATTLRMPASDALVSIINRENESRVGREEGGREGGREEVGEGGGGVGEGPLWKSL